MQGANKGAAQPLNGKGLRIGIVQARFNEEITDALAQACKGELEALGVAASDIVHVSVPGAPCLRTGPPVRRPIRRS